MQVVLVMFRADGERRSFSITRDVTVIGRREDCDLRIPLSDVSRKHCRFVKDGETVHIEDLGSSNGTYHNGQRVQEAILSPGDTIQVGPVVFCIQIDGVPAEDEMAPMIMAAPAEPGEGNDAGVAAELDELHADEPPATLGEAHSLEDDELSVLEEAPAVDDLSLEEPLGDSSVAGEAPALDDAAPPARPAVPPPPPAPAAIHEEEPIDLEEPPMAVEESGSPVHEEDDLLEDFEIISDEPEDSQSGDITVDTEH